MHFWGERDLNVESEGTRRDVPDAFTTRHVYLSLRGVHAAVRFVCSTLLILPAGSAVLEMRRIYSLPRDLTLPGVKCEKIKEAEGNGEGTGKLPVEQRTGGKKNSWIAPGNNGK